MKSLSSLEALHCTYRVAQALMSADGDDERLKADLSEGGAEHPDARIAEARELEILISSAELEEARRFFGPWIWGPAAAMLMFGYRADSFEVETGEPRSEGEEQDDPADVSRSAGLLPEAEGVRIELPDPPSDDLADLLRRRRSRRAFCPDPIDLGGLAACLNAGFGITGERVVDGRARPLTAAPASGALNTYDARVLVRTVTGLDPGSYNYLPQEHALVRADGGQVAFDRLFGGQRWAAQASCAIVLVADTRRQASRYVFPTTMSAVLVEAGARAELLLLQAERESLSAVLVGLAGVGAFDRELASQAGIWAETSMTIPVCAVLLGSPASNG